jgi:hypothetical protein
MYAVTEIQFSFSTGKTQASQRNYYTFSGIRGTYPMRLDQGILWRSAGDFRPTYVFYIRNSWHQSILITLLSGCSDSYDWEILFKHHSSSFSACSNSTLLTIKYASVFLMPANVTKSAISSGAENDQIRYFQPCARRHLLRSPSRRNHQKTESYLKVDT